MTPYLLFQYGLVVLALVAIGAALYGGVCYLIGPAKHEPTRRD